MSWGRGCAGYRNEIRDAGMTVMQNPGRLGENFYCGFRKENPKNCTKQVKVRQELNQQKEKSPKDKMNSIKGSQNKASRKSRKARSDTTTEQQNKRTTEQNGCQSKQGNDWNDSNRFHSQTNHLALSDSESIRFLMLDLI